MPPGGERTVYTALYEEGCLMPQPWKVLVSEKVLTAVRKGAISHLQERTSQGSDQLHGYCDRFFCRSFIQNFRTWGDRQKNFHTLSRS